MFVSILSICACYLLSTKNETKYGNFMYFYCVFHFSFMTPLYSHGYNYHATLVSGTHGQRSHVVGRRHPPTDGAAGNCRRTGVRG